MPPNLRAWRVVQFQLTKTPTIRHSNVATYVRPADGSPSSILSRHRCAPRRTAAGAGTSHIAARASANASRAVRPRGSAHKAPMSTQLAPTTKTPTIGLQPGANNRAEPRTIE